MGNAPRSDEQVAQHLSGMRAMERIREALEDRFEVEVREAVARGGGYPAERLHDYLTGVGDGHEPRVRLLFELHERGALDLSGPLADVPETCFFLGGRARYERSLRDWLGLFGAPRAYAREAGDPDELELYGAGDLIWSRSRRRADDAAGFLGLLLDRAVPVWRASVRTDDLQVVAVDRWAGRQEVRVVVPPGLLVAEPVDADPTSFAAVPLDEPLTPRPRIVDEL